ncbi:MAG: hypothetical protein KAI75_10880, partial [Desulfobulbaceae bacterium]|nr:hypothetical protein [Desulfobulbaceae bacterium]
ALNQIQITALEGAGTLYLDANANGANDGEDVTLNQVIAAADIAKLKFAPAADANGSPYTTFGFKVHDGTAYSAAASTMTVNITPVNDASVLTAGGTLNYIENDAPAVLDGAITLTDAENVIQSATVTINANYAEGEDILSFADTGSITGSWDAATATLTLTGTDTAANYQTALRSVVYKNIQDNPSTLSRAVTFTVNDGVTDSNSATASVNITAVNDAPSLTATGSVSYTEGDAAKSLAPDIIVADADSSLLSSANIQIIDNYHEGEDVLLFADQNGISGSWDASAGLLTLTGSATPANYEAALRSVLYDNYGGENPTAVTRTISIEVHDGAVPSAALLKSLTVTDITEEPFTDTTQQT